MFKFLSSSKAPHNNFLSSAIIDPALLQIGFSVRPTPWVLGQQLTS